MTFKKKKHSLEFKTSLTHYKFIKKKYIEIIFLNLAVQIIKRKILIFLLIVSEKRDELFKLKISNSGKFCRDFLIAFEQ